MTIFGAFNLAIFSIVIALVVYARFLKNPLSRSKFTTGDMVRSIGLMIMLFWCFMVGFFTSMKSLFDSFMLLFK